MGYSKDTDSTSPSMDTLSDNSLPIYTDSVQSKLNRKLNDAIGLAVDRYNKKKPRDGVINGWFTFFRHGSHGKKNAEQLKYMLEEKSLNGIMTSLNNYFNQPDTNFNNHSLAPYLLDSLNDLLKSLEQPSTQPENDTKYGITSWPSIRSTILNYQNTLQEPSTSLEIQTTL